jgi:hypothetical protein
MRYGPVNSRQCSPLSRRSRSTENACVSPTIACSRATPHQSFNQTRRQSRLKARVAVKYPRIKLVAIPLVPSFAVALRADVCCWHFSTDCAVRSNVCCWGKSGHDEIVMRLLLMTHNRPRPATSVDLSYFLVGTVRNTIMVPTLNLATLRYLQELRRCRQSVGGFIRLAS